MVKKRVKKTRVKMITIPRDTRVKILRNKKTRNLFLLLMTTMMKTKMKCNKMWAGACNNKKLLKLKKKRNMRWKKMKMKWRM